MTVGEKDMWFGGNRVESLTWAFLALMVCVHFTLTWGSLPDFLDLGRYARGLERLPYQTRVLPMYLLHFFAERPWMEATARDAPRQFRNPYKLVEMAVMVMSMMGAVLASWGTLARLTGDREFSRWFSLVLVYMAYFDLAPGWGLAYSLPYDGLSLLFFSCGVYLVVSGRVWWLYLLLPLADLNRETACFVSFFYLVWSWSSGSRRRDLSAHVVAQMTLWLAMRVYVGRLFSGNPTDGAPAMGWALFALKLPFNLRELAEPQQWPVLASTFGFLLPA